MTARGLGSVVWLGAVGLRNQVRRKIARVKDPKYAIAAIVGLLYFAWIFNPLAPGAGDGMQAELREVAMIAAPFGLAAFVVFWWVWGGYERVLAFSPSEVVMLFAAPLTRRELIHFKLFKSQLGVVLTALLIAVFILPGPPPWYARLLGLWVVTATLHFHQVASSLVRAGAVEQGTSGLRRAAVPLTVGVLATGAVALSLADAFPVLRSGDLQAAQYAFLAAFQQPVPQMVMLPFRFLLDPLWAEDLGAWAAAMPGAVFIFVLHYVWLVNTDAAFEEAAAAAGRKRAERMTALRAGRGMAIGAAQRPRGGWRRRLPLAPTGPPAVGIVWKNTLGFFGQVPPTTLMLLMGGVAMIGGVVFLASGSRTDTADVIALICAAMFALATFFGPIVIRADLRRDLESIEYLKALPVGGRHLVAAEIGASALALAFFQIVLMALGLAAMSLGSSPASVVTRVTTGAVGTLILLAPVNAMLVAIQNALTLLLPAWSYIGRDQPGGIEHMGRMILTVLATLIAAVITMAPPTIAALVAWIIVPGVGVAAILGGALAGSAVVALEVVLLVSWLGRVYDALDPIEAGLLR